MRILLVKTSSLGDVIHNLPVVSDLLRHFPDATIDWCVEENFTDIPRLHPGVAEVVPVAIRRWRQALYTPATWREIADARRRLRATRYDAVLDTQGLIKSALVTFCTEGCSYGYAAEVARETLASYFYDKTFVIPPNAHAVDRNRWLAAAAFGYPVGEPLDYGIVTPRVAQPWRAGPGGTPADAPYAVLLTATSRDDKLWAEERWVAVARHLAARGIGTVLPSGSVRERQRAERIASAINQAGACDPAGVPVAIVAPPLSLRELAALLGGARLAIGVDTGLVHLATALDVPTIALYVSTDPALTGVLGTRRFRNLGGRGRSPDETTVITAVDQELRQ